MEPYIIVGVLVAFGLWMAYLDIREGNELAAWYQWRETHRHCVERPYKLPRRYHASTDEC